MNECLSITIPAGHGSVQSLPDGSIQVTIPIDSSLEGYQNMSRAFIAHGVGVMFRGREKYGDLRPEQNPASEPDAPAGYRNKASAGLPEKAPVPDAPAPNQDTKGEAS